MLRYRIVSANSTPGNHRGDRFARRGRTMVQVGRLSMSSFVGQVVSRKGVCVAKGCVRELRGAAPGVEPVGGSRG